MFIDCSEDQESWQVDFECASLGSHYVIEINCTYFDCKIYMGSDNIASWFVAIDGSLSKDYKRITLIESPYNVKENQQRFKLSSHFNSKEAISIANVLSECADMFSMKK